MSRYVDSISSNVNLQAIFFFVGIVVREAFPCRSIETGQNDVNVEMDPTSAIETRQVIEDRGMKVVGWYHSHPTFIPDPSLIDIENQRNYQMLCREQHHVEGAIEPFVGAIVGPYDPALPASASAINWFYVNGPPRRLIYELKENESISQDETDRLVSLNCLGFVVIVTELWFLVV